jgi:hypothetical protein
MRDGNEATARVVDALERLGMEYFLAGSFSSNYYGIPRTTRDADFVIFVPRIPSSMRAESVVASRISNSQT